jgi:hypothetical protein
MFGQHHLMFGMNMWKRPEQVQQQRMQQLETGASALAQQVEVSIFFYNQKGKSTSSTPATWGVDIGYPDSGYPTLATRHWLPRHWLPPVCYPF